MTKIVIVALLLNQRTNEPTNQHNKPNQPNPIKQIKPTNQLNKPNQPNPTKPTNEPNPIN
jgi:hypothetical protein